RSRARRTHAAGPRRGRGARLPHCDGSARRRARGSRRPHAAGRASLAAGGAGCGEPGAGMTSADGFRIAHFSDLHCGSPHFQADLLERAIEEISELRPDVVVISGDLTTDGYKGEYEMAREFVDRIESRDLIVIPGNHDSRNVGYVHFEELFGPRASVLHKQGVTIGAEDSSAPDLD